jgi:membrane protein YdbS with pleckstrin-like domain
MIFWIIIGLLIVYSSGYITCSWNSSKNMDIQTTIIGQQDKIIDYMKAQIIELDNKVKEAENKIGCYPTYDNKA